jgi:23S rRNA (uracil1939-C5)-methyltransferase
VVLCEGGLPGERLTVDVVDSRRDFVRVRVREVLVAARERVAPPCPHVAEGCGGCTWQHVAAGAQPRLKADIVADALRHLGHLAVVPVVGPGLPLAGYRTSVHLGVDGDGRPAYRRRHAHATVAVGSCLVAHPLLEELLVESRFPGARTVKLRVGAHTGERLAVADRLSAPPQVPAGTMTSAGAAVVEEIAGRRWRLSASSFAQSGPDAWEAIIGAVRRAARGAAGGTVVDLYAGAGVLGGAVVAADGGRLVAVESHAAAVRDARANLADLPARVVHAEVARARLGLRSPPDLVVADPARAGLGPSAARAVAALGAPVVVLVSCDPASLARDARLLGSAGYRLEAVEVLDLFPGTFHVEAVSRFVASVGVPGPA